MVRKHAFELLQNNQIQKTHLLYNPFTKEQSINAERNTGNKHQASIFAQQVWAELERKILLLL
jgi:hypothetical protein